MSESDNYTYEIQTKRIDKGRLHTELQLLAQLPPGFTVSHSDSPFGLIIQVTVSAAAFPTDLNKDLIFEIHIEGKFPFQAPKIQCKTAFLQPSLADGRDLLRDIIGAQWTPSLTMNQLSQVRKLTVSQVSDLGAFHLGHPMYLNTWDTHPTMKAFYVMEVSGQESMERTLVITEAAVLVLEKSAKFEGIGHLLSWANLQSIENIVKSKTEPDRLTFHWKAIEDNPPFNQIFRVPEGDTLIALLNQNMFRLGATESQDWIAEEEVSASALQKVRVSELLEAISIYEKYMDQGETPERATRLLQLYQEAVEYFSALNDSRYDEYLQKMHSLLRNDQVLQALSPRS